MVQFGQLALVKELIFGQIIHIGVVVADERLGLVRLRETQQGLGFKRLQGLGFIVLLDAEEHFYGCTNL